ncbi:hypothetical protein GCM10020256_19390 [Streptomyces thermocoprophilus]
MITLLVVWPFARIGGWLPLLRDVLQARRAAAGPSDAVPPAALPPTQWPELREAGQRQAADTLTAEVAAGRMNDVDCARLRHAWRRARREGRLARFTDTVLRHGAAALTHPSGARDLPVRAARHDLLTGQVRIGRWADHERTPSPTGAPAPPSAPTPSARPSSSSARPAPARPGTSPRRSSRTSPCTP